MRIISGIYGHRRFTVPSTFSARPTTDFAKENLFNVLVHLIDLEGADALDLFAGTGSISFELLSHECRRVTTVEKNGAHAAFIAKVA
ncbi:MAG: RsmD family RNA methyltransferase, partial [Tannerellaceae bacterium]